MFEEYGHLEVDLEFIEFLTIDMVWILNVQEEKLIFHLLYFQYTFLMYICQEDGSCCQVLQGSFNIHIHHMQKLQLQFMVWLHLPLQLWPSQQLGSQCHQQ